MALAFLLQPVPDRLLALVVLAFLFEFSLLFRDRDMALMFLLVGRGSDVALDLSFEDALVLCALAAFGLGLLSHFGFAGAAFLVAVLKAGELAELLEHASGGCRDFKCCCAGKRDLLL